MILDKTLEELRSEAIASDGNPSKQKTMFFDVPMYNDDMRENLPAMIEVHKAHLVMLKEQGILNETECKLLKKAIGALDVDEIRKLSYDPKVGDFFYTVQKLLIDSAGSVGGSLHLGRSRNDLGATYFRMVLRESLLKLLESVNKLAQGLLVFAEDNKDTLMVEYTHMHHAQPGTMGHVLSGFVNVLCRDLTRMECAYKLLNLSPLGSGAITTSGFNINRRTTMDLLGFDDIMECSYDGIASTDHGGGTAAAVAVFATDLGRILTMLMNWTTHEFDFLHIADPYVVTSSMMPQKRGPQFEKLRVETSNAFGDCLSTMTAQHNVTYEDCLEVNFTTHSLLRGMRSLSNICEMLYTTIVTTTVYKKKLAENAMNSFAVMTEFCDTLVRSEHISYFEAHHVAYALVDACTEKGIGVRDVPEKLIAETYENVLGKKLTCPESEIHMALDAGHFVAIRNVEGGPAPKPMAQVIERAAKHLREHEKWLQDNQKHLQTSDAKLQKAFASI